MRNHFYVYAWLDGDTAFYIGKGTGGRMMPPNHGKRATRLREEAGSRFRRLVIACRMTKREANNSEFDLIKLLLPNGNQVGLTKAQKRLRNFFDSNKWSDFS